MKSAADIVDAAWRPALTLQAKGAHSLDVFAKLENLIAALRLLFQNSPMRWVFANRGLKYVKYKMMAYLKKPVMSYRMVPD